MNETTKNPVLFIAGPTASGKSAHAIKLAQALNGVIINADSMQVYEDLRVLSARPSIEEEAQAPHRLYGMVEAGQNWSVAKWLEAALTEVESCWALGQLPILTGGTGLYFKALEQGLAHIPDVPKEIQEEADDILANSGIQELWAQLEALDNESFDRLHPNDRQRIRRSWEVARATGHPLSYWYAQGQSGLLSRGDVRLRRYAITPDRDTLYARCEKRVLHMVENGALDEVRALLNKEPGQEKGVMKALGVPELAAFLTGDLSLDDAISLLQRNTRRYAKRQLTWFRHQAAHWEWQDTQLNVKNIIDSFS